MGDMLESEIMFGDARDQLVINSPSDSDLCSNLQSTDNEQENQMSETIIYGSPDAVLYFEKQAHTVSDNVAIEVPDLSVVKSKLVVRPLSSPTTYFDRHATKSSASSCASGPNVEMATEEDVTELDRHEVYTEEEDIKNKAHAARVASVLNDVHRSSGEPDADVLADRLAEEILASALFETVFLQDDPIESSNSADERGIGAELSCYSAANQGDRIAESDSLSRLLDTCPITSSTGTYEVLKSKYKKARLLCCMNDSIYRASASCSTLNIPHKMSIDYSKLYPIHFPFGRRSGI